MKEKSLSTDSSDRECRTQWMANIRGDKINPGKMILPLPNGNDFLGEHMSW
jgi:hypothetical protein